MFSIVMAASMVAAPEPTGFFFKFSCGNPCYTHSCATPIYTHGGCCTTTCATPVHVQSTCCVTPTYHRGGCGLFSCFKSICHTPVYAAPCGTATPCHPVVVTPATPAPKEAPKETPKTPKEAPKETPKEAPKEKPKQ